MGSSGNVSKSPVCRHLFSTGEKGAHGLVTLGLRALWCGETEGGQVHLDLRLRILIPPCRKCSTWCPPPSLASTSFLPSFTRSSCSFPCSTPWSQAQICPQCRVFFDVAHRMMGWLHKWLLKEVEGRKDLIFMTTSCRAHAHPLTESSQ